MKACSKCKEHKCDEFFSFKKNGLPGLKSACKACHAADIRARYAADPAPRLLRTKERRKDPDVRLKINQQRNQLRRQQPSKVLVALAAKRARDRGLPFDLVPEDVPIPSHCPVLGIEFHWGRGKRQKDDSPTLDRVRGDFGYVKGNVRVISWRANRLKSDATLEELKAVVAYYEAALGVATTAQHAIDKAKPVLARVADPLSV